MTAKSEIGWNLENSYKTLPEVFYSNTLPEKVRASKLILMNEQLATELGLTITALKSKVGTEVLAGNELPKSSMPISQAYAGHQFGQFTMLGDGRAVLLGEHITPTGERVDIQLKGSGRTPFSRGGDGRAALGPMLREYLISEAMHGLGIPTTRSLAVVATGEKVIRETDLKGAILTRVSSSHLRVGTFQYAAARDVVEDVRALADYAIERHYPDVKVAENPYVSFLENVIHQQASLVAKWQLVGFVHGVMNTDNMTISGETIDYGPCAFIDTFDPSTVFSSIDRQGRYAFGNQPTIAAWNLARFAETLLPLLDDNKDEALKQAQQQISTFSDVYHEQWKKGMREKLGIFNVEEQDAVLINDLLALMHANEADYTNTFLALTTDDLSSEKMFKTEAFKQWNGRWQDRRSRQTNSINDSKQLMRKTNPTVIPRNHRVEEALDAAVNDEDYSFLKRLLHVVTDPYSDSIEHREYTQLPPSKVPYQTYCGT